jgi:hypothetical protein
MASSRIRKLYVLWLCATDNCVPGILEPLRVDGAKHTRRVICARNMEYAKIAILAVVGMRCHWRPVKCGLRNRPVGSFPYTKISCPAVHIIRDVHTHACLPAIIVVQWSFRSSDATTASLSSSTTPGPGLTVAAPAATNAARVATVTRLCRPMLATQEQRDQAENNIRIARVPNGSTLLVRFCSLCIEALVNIYLNIARTSTEYNMLSESPWMYLQYRAM